MRLRRDQLRPDADVALLVFELNALVIAANSAFILHGDPTVINRARSAVERTLAAEASGSSVRSR